MAWNAVSVEGGQLLQGGAAYFANSYRIADPPPGRRGQADRRPLRGRPGARRVLACQFHPELSGPGAALLSAGS